jgi:hypothetical protein
MSAEPTSYSILTSVTIEGFTMYADPSRCDHAGFHACATCDFDDYYAIRFPEMCPWSVWRECT